MPGQQHNQPTLRFRWVEGVCVFRCNLPPALLAAHKVNTGEEISPAAPAGIRTRNLSITSTALYQRAIPTPTATAVTTTTIKLGEEQLRQFCSLNNAEQTVFLGVKKI